MGNAGSKRCTKCNEEKALEEFHRRNTQGVRDGRASWCKACDKAKSAAWYKKNREQVIAKTSAYHRANPDKAREAVRRWTARNPDKVRAYNQLYIARDPEGWRARSAKWDRENRDKQLARQARRRARKLAAFVEDVTLDDLIPETGNLCGICGDPIEEPPHIDHIVPLAAGGRHEIANCQLAHPSCNYRKSARTDYVAA